MLQRSTNKQYIYIYFNIFIYIYIYICDMYWYIWYARIIYNIHMPVFEFQILKVDHQRTQQNPPLTMEEMLSCQIFGQEMLWLRHELIRSFSKRPSKRLSQRSSTAIVICMFLVDGSNILTCFNPSKKSSSQPTIPSMVERQQFFEPS